MANKTIEEISEMWGRDSTRVQLGVNISEEQIKTQMLHHRYSTLLMWARRELEEFLTPEYNVLYKDKREFYIDGHDEITRAKGWKLPPKGTIIKSEVDIYIKADPDISALKIKIEREERKIHLLNEILKSIHGRGYQLAQSVESFKVFNGLQ